MLSAAAGSATVDVRCHSRARSSRARATASASSTVSPSNTLAVWNLRPMPSRTHSNGGSLPIAWPLISMAPDERSRPSLMQRMSVVLPAPFGPTSDSSSPWRASKPTLRSTVRLPKCLATACSLSASRPLPAVPAGGRSNAVVRRGSAAGTVVARRKRSRPNTAGSRPLGMTTITSTNDTPRISFQTNGRSPLR